MKGYGSQRDPGTTTAGQKGRSRALLAGAAVLVAVLLVVLFLRIRPTHVPAPPETSPSRRTPAAPAFSLKEEASAIEKTLLNHLAEEGLLAKPIELSREEKGRGDILFEQTVIRATLSPEVSIKRLKDRIRAGIDQLMLPVDYNSLRQGNDHITLNLALRGLLTHRVHFRFENSPGGARPLIAIVIDDLGQSYRTFQSLLEIDAPLTFSILPYTPRASRIAERAYALGRETLLHVPMEAEPATNNNRDKGILLTEMTEEQILAQLEEAMKTVPFICGVNNHKGSKFTERPEKMEIVLKALKEKDLIFLDSRTTKNTVGYLVARTLGVEAAERDVFLDNLADSSYTRNQLLKLAALSEERGWAIGIAHPHPSTIATLSEMIPELKEKGFQFVPVSRLVN